MAFVQHKYKIQKAKLNLIFNELEETVFTCHQNNLKVYYTLLKFVIILFKKNILGADFDEKYDIWTLG